MSILKPIRTGCRAGILALSLVLPPFATGQQTCNPAVSSSTPDSDFTVNNDGTVTHHKTGLMWLRDPLNGTYSWEQALMEAEGASFVGYTDWRLPNAKELASIVETRCYAPSINLAVFPSTPSMEFWTSTPFVASQLSPSAWVVWFRYGSVASVERNYSGYVRLVRGGQ